MAGAFAPGIVALLLTAWKEGVDGVRALIGRILIADVAARYYLFAVSYMLSVKLTAAMLHRAMLGTWPRFGDEPLLLMPLAVAFSTPFQAGEELGWRGYALPRLAARFGLARAGLVLGAIWAFWHLPQFYIADADTYHQPFIVWGAQVIAISVTFAWLYAKTGGSLLLVMLLHAAINNTKDIVPAGAAPPPGVFSLHEAVLIDPVIEQLERDLKLVREHGLTLKYILETHVHADHITASLALKQATGAQTAVSLDCNAQGYDRMLEEGNVILFGREEILVIATPGHTSGSVSYLWRDRVLTGDTLLIGGCGRTDFQNGSAEALWLSITEKLFQLDDQVLVYPGHADLAF